MGGGGWEKKFPLEKLKISVRKVHFSNGKNTIFLVRKIEIFR
jgi:hypothetical protein